MSGVNKSYSPPKAYSPAVLALAARHGIAAAGLPGIINGCSGGFSKFYWFCFRRACSCEAWCELHDLRYHLGGTAAQRKLADQELRRGAISAGKPVPGWLEKLRRDFVKISRLFGWLPPLRKAWRWLRAWAMYGAVRCFGKSHWNENGPI